MNELFLLRGSEPERVIQLALEQRIPAVMSYLSRGTWKTARILITETGRGVFSARVSPRKKSCQVNVTIDQPIGISFKCGYEFGKFVFDSVVTGVKQTTAGDIEIQFIMPEQVEFIQRRSYFRVQVPRQLDVSVMMYKHGYIDGYGRVCPEYCRQGRVVDISAGGMQVAVDAGAGRTEGFEKGQSIGLRFVPLPHETAFMFNAYIKNIVATAEEGTVCFGLQMIGLEASPQGRLILQRLCSVVEQYYTMNQAMGNNVVPMSL